MKFIRLKFENLWSSLPTCFSYIIAHGSQITVALLTSSPSQIRPGGSVLSILGDSPVSPYERNLFFRGIQGRV